MEDYIDNETAPTTSSTIDRVFSPTSDGIFEVLVTAKAEGNNHGTPSMWVAAMVNGTAVEPKQAPIAWQDGPNEIQFKRLVMAKSGVIYNVHGMSGNENANARGIDMRIRRVH